MQTVHYDEKQIWGITLRTDNADEMNPHTARIGGLWQKFGEAIAPKLNEECTVYGVYHDYESDANGEFTVLAGADLLMDTTGLEKVTVEAGNYLVFDAQGEMPRIVIDTWAEIWDYFSSGDAKFQRAFTTDFERYTRADKVEIYIAVTQLP